MEPVRVGDFYIRQDAVRFVSDIKLIKNDTEHVWAFFIYISDTWQIRDDYPTYPEAEAARSKVIKTLWPGTIVVAASHSAVGP